MRRKEQTKELDTKALDEILRQFPSPTEADIIPILQAIQERYGYLPPEILEAASRRTRLPLNRMCGVATFYSQFSYQPRGRHTIRVCRGTACHVRGSARILAAVSNMLGISEGETTDDLRFTLETVACLGTCFLSPAVMVDNRFFGKVTADQIKNLLDAFR